MKHWSYLTVLSLAIVELLGYHQVFSHCGSMLVAVTSFLLTIEILTSARGFKKQMQRIAWHIDRRLEQRCGRLVRDLAILRILRTTIAHVSIIWIRRRRRFARFDAVPGCGRCSRLRPRNEGPLMLIRRCITAKGQGLVLGGISSAITVRILVIQVITSFCGTPAVLSLPLSSRRGEVALFAFASTPHAGRVVGFVDRSKIASHLSASTRYLRYCQHTAFTGLHSAHLRMLDMCACDLLSCSSPRYLSSQDGLQID